MKNLILVNRLPHPVGAEWLLGSGKKFQTSFCLWVVAGLLLLYPRLLQAQIYNGPMILSTQAQVNAFNYTEVTGNLTIQGSGIYDLRPLAILTKVGGPFRVEQTSLGLYSIPGSSSLAGLENLTSVGEGLVITNNSHLSNLAGLKNLASVAGNLVVSNNSSLSSLAGLENLTSSRAVIISDNNSLSSLARLEKLTSVGYLAITFNGSLSSLAGLEKLTSVGGNFMSGDISITGNNSLNSLAGLEKLTSVGGGLTIFENYNLSSLAGMDNLTSVGRDLSINNNSNLTSLVGLEKLTSVGSDLYVRDNAKLSQCCRLLSVIQATEGAVNISNNATNCTSPAEIEAACTPTTITAQPNDVTVCTGEKAIFQVEATGSNLTYQWRKGTKPIPGATSPTYSIEAVSAEDAGDYSVEVIGTYTTVTSNAATLTVKPALVLGEVTAPTAPVAVNTSVSLSVSFSGSTVSSATWNWGDGSTSPAIISGNTLQGNHKYTKAGTYSPILTVTDACGQTTQATYEYVVVYESGAITGAGGFASPKQAYKADTKLAGTAVLGLYARYKKGTSLPEGSTLFAFKAGKVKLAFASTVYETLTISGTKARYTGRGRINGQGNYGFLVSLLDGRPDKFRIKIWNKDKGNQIVYDNNLSNTAETADPATAIVGFILIQTSQAAVARLSVPGVELAITEKTLPVFKNYPNPFTEKTTLEFTFNQDEEYTLAIYDLSGKLVSQLPSGTAKAGEHVQVEWQAGKQAKGVYLARLKAAKSVQQLKLVVE
ncbi:T9SS type A sorting domain-containing protein [Adhaeribacter arboris]|nr:T9SS type A sorting domain-containing protein [Adhaeribacter arboris]